MRAIDVAPMDLESLLLVVAFRHAIREPDVDTGLRQIAAIAGRPIDPNTLHEALAALVAAGCLHDPVRLPPGALQCHWSLDLTPLGIGRVTALLRGGGKTADELIAAGGTGDA